MKKGIFLPMLAIFTILIVGILGLMFYQNTIKSRNEIVGQKADFVIKTIMENEKNNFFIEDSARLAFCDSLENISNSGVGCITSGFPVFSFGFDSCNTQNNLDASFKKYFDQNFLRYTHSRKEFKDMKYTFETEKDGFSLVSEPVDIETKDDASTIQIKYPFKVDIKEKIISNLDEYKSIIKKAGEYKTCIANGKSVDVCNNEMQLSGSRSDNLIKFEISSIKNPCNLRQINIKFALDTSNKLPISSQTQIESTKTE